MNVGVDDKIYKSVSVLSQELFLYLVWQIVKTWLNDDFIGE